MKRVPRHHRPLAKLAEQQGWQVKLTKGNHLMWVSPTGDRVYCAATPSDKRAFRNHLAQMRRAGFKD